MVKLFRKLLIFGGMPIRTTLPEQGIFAEYDLLDGTLIWKKRDEDDNQRTMSFISRLLTILIPLAGVPMFLSSLVRLIESSSAHLITPEERVGIPLACLLPILVMFIMSMSFEYLMHYFKKNSRVIEPPEISEQIIYLEDLYATTIRHNATLSQYKTPYIAIVVVVFSFVLLNTGMWWVYWQASSLSGFFLKLFLAGILLTTTFPIMFRYAFLRTVVVKKILRGLYERKIG